MTILIISTIAIYLAAAMTVAILLRRLTHVALTNVDVAIISILWPLLLIMAIIAFIRVNANG